MRASLRRKWMGLSTLFGRPMGFFSPYRYAQSVAPCAYPELEEVFRAAEPSMRAVLARIEAAMPELAAFDGPPPLPRWGQQWFPRLDGAAAFALVRDHAPRRIIEVGSGHSTRFLARAAGRDCDIACIDPQPRAALLSLPVRWEKRVLSGEDIALFRALEPGDVAFFDSSHLLWPGSDVDLIVNRILPVLRQGVLVHVHDVLLPDAYPESWGWRGYTEQLGLGGWLAGGGAEILFSSHYARTRMAAEAVVADIPLSEGALETSLWLKRV